MSRDDLPYKTHVINVTSPQLTNSSTIPAHRHYLKPTIPKPDLYYPTNQTDAQTFYQTYNPETGINIATFLGGVLVLLVLYVIYRTKCRKRMLKALQKCTMKYFPEDFPQVSNKNSQSDLKLKTNEAEWISEGPKMIWKERANLSRDSELGTRCYRDDVSCMNGEQGQCMYENTGEGACCTECDDTCDCVVNMFLPHPPDTEENTEHATAQWVRSVQDMDLKERQLNGIILKIPPDLVSHNSKIRSHFNSVTEYGDDETVLNISQQRNISLPCLIERQTRSKPSYANTHYNRTLTAYGYVPLASQERVDLDSDYRHQDTDDEHSHHNKIPLDICPIVKVQHYHSRSKRRLTSLCRSSSDDISTSSSDDQNIDQITSAREAKYLRLQTEDTEMCVNNDKQITFANNHGMAPNCRNNHQLGNHTESIV